MRFQDLLNTGKGWTVQRFNATAQPTQGWSISRPALQAGFDLDRPDNDNGESGTSTNDLYDPAYTPPPPAQDKSGAHDPAVTYLTGAQNAPPAVPEDHDPAPDSDVPDWGDHQGEIYALRF